MRNLTFSLAVLMCALGQVMAQSVQVNRANKTIAVTADETVLAEPEVAALKVGYHAYAQTKEEAYQQVVETGNKIAPALIKAGLPEKDIETGDVVLSRIPGEESWTPDMKNLRQFEARQTWKFRVAPKAAQTFIDSAVQAGANEFETPEWDVADPAALQAKASAAALVKARKVAEQMAIGLGARLGELVYASNRVPYGNPSTNMER